jgi:hypothetical protein
LEQIVGQTLLRDFFWANLHRCSAFKITGSFTFFFCLLVMLSMNNLCRILVDFHVSAQANLASGLKLDFQKASSPKILITATNFLAMFLLCFWQ